ncbi:response regulator [bacterium]|nr:response regulator [bacterium]
MRPESKTILTVDDTPANIRLLTHYLQKQGYRVITAEDGFEGFKAAVQYHPDLVLLDIMMPGTDGYEVCELLKAEEETKDIPVVFLTAKADVEDKIKGFELGAVDYITKPFNLVEIATRVETQLNLKYLQEQNNRYHKMLSETRRLTNLGIIGDAVIQHVHDSLDDLLKDLQKMIKKQEFDKVGQHAVYSVLKNVADADATIKKMIKQNQQKGMEKEIIDMDLIIEDVLDLVHDDFNDSMHIEYQKSESVLHVTGYYYLLQQAILNFLSYLSMIIHEKTVNIHVEQSPLPKELIKLLKSDHKTAVSFVRIDISNEGTLEKDALVSVEADLFVRTEKEKDLNVELSATLNIVKEHGGVFYIQSNGEKRTTASIYLPMHQS